jgi:type II secretory ATPase GspE/PulE/Tfp pilus assembly ATPase PilB-like protein
MVSHSRLNSFLPALSAPTARIYRPAGCVRCSGGYSGRIAVMEMAASSPELVAAIEERVPSRELEQVARAHSGFRSMVENGVDMITHGVTSLQEIESISLAAES